jgi:hypothetical protein
LTAALLVLCAGGASAAASAAPEPQPDRGPLGLRTQGTLRELFLDVTGADARAVERPSLELRYTVSNVWNEAMDLSRHGDRAQQELDEQADALGVKLTLPWSAIGGEGPALLLPGSARPLFQRLSTAVELKLTEHWGGWSDRPIEAWHRLIGSFNFDRELHPRNRLRLYVADAGGTAFDLERPTLAFGDVAIRTQFLLAEGGLAPASPGGSASPKAPAQSEGATSALSLRFDFKLPTGRLASAGGSGGFDAAVALLGTAQVSSAIALHGLVAVARFGGFSAPLLLQPKPWHFTAEVSAVFDLGLLQILLEDRVVSPLLQPGWNRLESFGDDGLLSSGYFAGFRPHNQITWGLRVGRFSVWLSEDFTPGSNPRSSIPFYYESNSPDVTIGARWLQPL